MYVLFFSQNLCNAVKVSLPLFFFPYAFICKDYEVLLPEQCKRISDSLPPELFFLIMQKGSMRREMLYLIISLYFGVVSVYNSGLKAEFTGITRTDTHEYASSVTKSENVTMLTFLSNMNDFFFIQSPCKRILAFPTSTIILWVRFSQTLRELNPFWIMFLHVGENIWLRDKRQEILLRTTS